MPIPSSVSKKKREEYMEGKIIHQTRPDTTNLNKQFEDCCTSVLFYDDKQVVKITGKKKYGVTPGTWIRMYEYKEQ